MKRLLLYILIYCFSSVLVYSQIAKSKDSKPESKQTTIYDKNSENKAKDSELHLNDSMNNCKNNSNGLCRRQKDRFIDNDGDGINDNRCNGIGVGKLKGSRNSKCKGKGNCKKH